MRQVRGKAAEHGKGNPSTRDIFWPLWPGKRPLNPPLSFRGQVHVSDGFVSSEVCLSPILVRPVREQLEHDRVIRLLQAKYKRKYEVAINPGHEQTSPVGPPQSPWYPDLVLFSNDRGKKQLAGVVEVETAESVNNLEAMSQWVAFGKLKVEFHLYVPVSGVDSTRRLCADLQIPATEIWAYSAIGDQIRFTAIQRSASSAPEPVRAARPAAEPKPVRARETPPARAAAKPAATPARAKPVARRAAPTPVAKARPAKARAAAPAPRRSAAKAPARKAAPASRAQKRK